MAMRGRPCGRRRLTRPAKLRKRIISPPRHGGKASVWRNRSAIPRAPRALFRFGNVGSFCQMPPCRASRTGRGSSTDAALLFIVIFVVFFIVLHCYLRRAGTPGAARKAARHKAKFAPLVQRRHCYFIVINNAAVRERRAQQQADSTTSAHKSGTRCRSGQKCFPASSPGSAPSYSRCQTARSRAGGNASSLRAARDRRPSGIAPGDHVECESF
jgi:hypothetical protein